MDNETISVPQTTQAAQVTPTPGPWELRKPGRRGEGYHVFSPSGWICSLQVFIDRHGNPLPEVEANGNLLAAAPDLLAACESALWLIIELDASGSAQWEVKDQLRAVIAQAKGEAS